MYVTTTLTVNIIWTNVFRYLQAARSGLAAAIAKAPTPPLEEEDKKKSGKMKVVDADMYKFRIVMGNEAGDADSQVSAAV